MKIIMNKIKTGFCIIAIVSVLFLGSCNNYNQEKLRKQELELLDTYVNKHNITVTPTKTGLYYMEVKKGTGDSIIIGDRVQVWYKTYLIDSTLIDDSGRYNPLEFYVTAAGSSSVIEGLNEGIKLMRKGGIGNFIIPSELAYGQNGSSGIPGFTTLLMNVEVYKVYKN
jgi:FKBP-type peptidyl-prolyl cis-trans isomerase FkpA